MNQFARPLVPAQGGPGAEQRLLSELTQLGRGLASSGAFLLRSGVSKILRPSSGAPAIELKWNELNRVSLLAATVVVLPRIEPKTVGVPLYVNKTSPIGTMGLVASGVALGEKRAPRIDGLRIKEQSAPGLYVFVNDGSDWSLVSNDNFMMFDVRAFGALPNRDRAASANVVAIKRAVAAAEDVGRGMILFPGSRDYYSVDETIRIYGSNITLWAPGMAQLRPAESYGTYPLLTVGDVETQINQSQGNLLAANAAQNDVAITLAAGKGANFEEDEWALLVCDLVIPEHDDSVGTAVVNKTAEFVNIESIAGDVLTLARTLRYPYTTASNGQLYKVSWVKNFAIDGLGVDGNDHTALSLAYNLSGCEEPTINNVSARRIAQRFLRFQLCRGARVTGVRQSDGFSTGYFGTGFAYMIAEQGLNEDLIATHLHADRVRHGYTTGAGWLGPDGLTSSVITGIGVPTNSLISQGIHVGARGAGFDTHEVGVDIRFHQLQTIGGKELGFQVRSVRTVFDGCVAQNCVGARLQIGSDARGTDLTRPNALRGQNCNTGATSIDWRNYSTITDNSPTGQSRFLLGQPNLLDNGGFDIWDRGTSFTATGGTANRWKLTKDAGATLNVRRRDGDFGDRPFGGRYYLRFDRSLPAGVVGAGPDTVSQYVEDVRTLAGEKATLSFDARDSVDGTLINIYVRQRFGTAGGPSADVTTLVSTQSIDATWRRRSITFDVPSITGKTIGTDENSSLEVVFELPVAAGLVFLDIDRVKLEPGELQSAYELEPLAETRQRCSRWYETSYATGQVPPTASSLGVVTSSAPAAPGGHAFSWGRNTFFTTRKGAIPTIVISAPATATVNRIRNISAGTDIAVTVSGVDETGFFARPSNSGDVAANAVCQWSWVASIADFE